MSKKGLPESGRVVLLSFGHGLSPDMAGFYDATKKRWMVFNTFDGAVRAALSTPTRWAPLGAVTVPSSVWAIAKPAEPPKPVVGRQYYTTPRPTTHVATIDRKERADGVDLFFGRLVWCGAGSHPSTDLHRVWDESGKSVLDSEFRGYDLDLGTGPL